MENELWHRWSEGKVGEWAELYTVLYTVEQSSLSNLSVTSPTSKLILQPFRRFTYVKAHSPTLPLLHLRHSSFSNPSFASPTSQALHLIHLESRPWFALKNIKLRKNLFTSWVWSISILYFIHAFSFKFATRCNPYRSLLFCTYRIFSAFFLISVIFWSVEITCILNFPNKKITAGYCL